MRPKLLRFELPLHLLSQYCFELGVIASSESHEIQNVVDLVVAVVLLYALDDGIEDAIILFFRLSAIDLAIGEELCAPVHLAEPEVHEIQGGSNELVLAALGNLHT